MKLITIPHETAHLISLELMPDTQGEWDSDAGRLAIHFFEIGDSNKVKYSPHVVCNVHLDELKPSQARAWGECLLAASIIASREVPIGILNAEQAREIGHAWQTINTLRAKLEVTT